MTFKKLIALTAIAALLLFGCNTNHSKPSSGNVWAKHQEYHEIL